MSVPVSGQMFKEEREGYQQQIYDLHKQLAAVTAERDKLKAEREQWMNQEPVGYLYLAEGGYNHEEEEKFSKTQPLMGFSNNLTVITAKLYAHPLPAPSVQEVMDELLESSDKNDTLQHENAQLTKKLAEYQAAILKYENVNQADLYFPEEELATLLSAEYQRGIEEGKRMAVPEGIVSIDAGFDYLQCVHTPWLKLYFASGTDCNELWVKRDKAKAMLAASPKPKEE